MPPNVGQPQYMPPQQPLLQYQQPQQQYQQQYLPPSSSQQLYLNLAQQLQPPHQYFHPLGGQQQQYPQQQWYPQQQRYPQQQQFDQLHQQYQQPPLPSQQCPTPAIYTSTSHTQYPRHALSADISLAPTYLSADATALRTIDETVPMSPEAAAHAAEHTPQCLPWSAAHATKKHTPAIKRLPKCSRECECAYVCVCECLSVSVSVGMCVIVSVIV